MTVVAVMTHVGMVAFVVTTILMSQATMLVLAPEHSAWRNGAIASALVMVGVVLVWSFRTSLGGRSVLPQD